MNQSSKDMILFCLDFVKANIREQSQNVQCRTWLKTAMETIEKEGLGSGDYLISELKSADRYLAGSDASSTSEQILDKVRTVEEIIKGEPS